MLKLHPQFRKVGLAQASFEIVNISAVSISVGSAEFPDFYSTDREETSVGVVFDNWHRKYKMLQLFFFCLFLI